MVTKMCERLMEPHCREWRKPIVDMETTKSRTSIPQPSGSGESSLVRQSFLWGVPVQTMDQCVKKLVAEAVSSQIFGV